MAKIYEEVIVIKLSKLFKDDDEVSSAIAGSEVQQALEQVAQELVGEGIIVEVERVSG
jgi:hypothetical protein